MDNLKFTDTEEQLTEQDMRLIEQDLGVTIPSQLRAHYLGLNGGTPEKTVFCDKSGSYDGVEIRDFIPMLYNKSFEDAPEYTLNGTAKLEWMENTLPKHLLPFAMDWGGNYICINLTTEEIVYFVRDVWIDSLTTEKNFQRNTRLMCSSFNELLESLVVEEEEE